VIEELVPATVTAVATRADLSTTHCHGDRACAVATAVMVTR
jgi:hypothetical protein